MVIEHGRQIEGGTVPRPRGELLGGLLEALFQLLPSVQEMQHTNALVNALGGRAAPHFTTETRRSFCRLQGNTCFFFAAAEEVEGHQTQGAHGAQGVC